MPGLLQVDAFDGDAEDEYAKHKEGYLVHVRLSD